MSRNNSVHASASTAMGDAAGRFGTIARGIRQFVCFDKLKIENTEASSTVSALNSRPALAKAFGDYSNGYYFPETPH
jgi:hypothetical protein